MEGEIKAAPLEIKAMGDRGEYEGHFGVFNNVDDGGDMCHPGMFLKTIAENGRRVKPLFMHDFEKLLGPTPDILGEDNTGLYAKGHITLGTFWGDQVWTLMKDNALNEGSFMYLPVKYDHDREGVRHLREVKLYDISFVPLGMNGATSVRAIKAAQLRHARAVIPFKAGEIVDAETWDPAAVLAACDTPQKLRAAHAWQNPDASPDSPEAYKLLHHDADGKCVRAALTTAAVAILTGTSGVPDEDLDAVREHLGEHFKQFNLTAPWTKGADASAYAAALVAITNELKEGRMLSASNLGSLRQAIDAMGTATTILTELCMAADPDYGKTADTPDTPDAPVLPAAPAIVDMKRVANLHRRARAIGINI